MDLNLSDWRRELIIELRAGRITQDDLKRALGDEAIEIINAVGT